MFTEIGKMLGDLQIENDKLKQTLAEIRDVAENREIFCENCSGGCDEFTCDDCGYVKIIQKIGEVEDEK